jgi:hypothetical protein
MHIDLDKNAIMGKDFIVSYSRIAHIIDKK